MTVSLKRLFNYILILNKSFVDDGGRWCAIIGRWICIVRKRFRRLRIEWLGRWRRWRRLQMLRLIRFLLIWHAISSIRVIEIRWIRLRRHKEAVHCVRMIKVSRTGRILGVIHEVLRIVVVGVVKSGRELWGVWMHRWIIK